MHLLELLAELINKGQGETIVNLKEYKELESKEYNTAQAVLKQLDRKQAEHTAYLLQTMIADKPFRDMEQLRNINIPTLILCSHDDFLHPYHYGLILQENIQHSIFKEVPSRFLNNDLYEKSVLQEVSIFLNQNKLVS